MKQYVINQFHFHGTFVAGDNFDIHDNSSVTFCQGERYTTESATSDVCAEDVTPIEPHAPCPFLVLDKLNKLGLYTPEQFETMFQEVAESDAKHLAEFLHRFKDMGVLNFAGLGKKEIFAVLQAHFPTMKKYSYSNFAYYF